MLEMESLGLIAGHGMLPAIVIQDARKQGIKKIAVSAIHGETDTSIAQLADTVSWVRLGELGKVIQFFKKEKISRAILAGKITKTNLFKFEVRPDFDMVRALAGLKNNNDDSLLGAIVSYLERKGIQILPTTSFLSEEALPGPGVLTKRKPTRKEARDIEYGWKLAKEMGRVDVGQTVVVKNQAVLAVEAIEGTDEAIKRGGMLGRGDVVVVKTAKPKQDMRFDVPAVGMQTFKVMMDAGVRVLAIEAGKTIVLNSAELVEEADRKKITIVARES